MSTFSSVARKPGAALKPRAAPRRIVPRQAQKGAVAATLTPESLPASPDIHPTSPSRPVSEKAPLRELDSSIVVQEPNPALTPPATALERLSPPPQPPNENAVTTSSATAPAEESSASQAGDEVPAVIASASRGWASSKRRAEEAPIDVDNATITTPQTQPSANSRSKRRKVVPQGGASYLLSRPVEPASRAQTETPAERRSASVAGDRARASTDDLLQQATASFGSVSKIAGSIETRTRSLRPRSAQRSGATYTETDNEGDAPPRRRPARSSRSTAIADLAEAVINDATGRGRKRGRRAATPEDAEAHEIDINEVSMKDLTKDTGLGKRSATGKELDENWAEISRRWKEGPDENRRKAQAKTQEEKDARKANEKAAAAAAAQNGEELVGVHVRTEIVNGLIVTVDGSREMEYSQNLPAAVESGAITAREVRKVDNYINSNRIGKNAGLRTRKNWDDESDELFYKGLRMFGTDFEMIASLFATRRRAEIKAKYTREERENWERVKSNLEKREKWTTESVAEMTGREEPWEVPEELDAELKREEERMKREAKEKEIAEGLIANPDADGDDVPIQSIEGAEPVAEEGETPEVSEHRRRIRALAGEAVDRDMRPESTKTPVQTRKRGPRRTRDATTTKTAKGKKGKQTLAGVEEVVGTVRDMEQP